MTPRIIAIATVVTAAVAFSATADAGSGVRLNFGMPLGSFTAKPAYGGGSSYDGSYARKAASRKAAAIAEKQAASKAEARKATRVAKVEEPTPSKRDTSKPEPLSEKSPTVPASGSTAFIETATQAKPAETAAIEPVKDTETSSSPDTTAATKAAAPSNETKPEETKTAQSEKALGCKKFIPAIGITVSISCDD